MEMALFTAASKHFVKSAGNSTLHYVPDLNSADRFNVLCLVKRKRSFWPWEKPKIKPTMITLNDILERPIDTSKLINTLLVAEAYKDTPSFNANGDIGTKIATEFDIDLSTTDKFSLNVNFGDITKTEVKWEPLEKSLAITAANANHEIFKEIEQKKRTSLCVVLESLACKKESPLDETSATTEKGKVSGTTPKATGVSVDVHMQGEVDQTNHHSYTIPPGTVIGFSCTKLDLNESGILSMHIGVDKVDSIEAHMMTPASKEEKMKEELAPLFDFKKLAEFKSILRGILQTPQCIDNLLELVSTASVIVEDGRPFAMSVDHISSQLTGVKGWKDFLEMVGFKIPESVSKDSKTDFPTADKDKLLLCSWAILESASELSENEIKTFLQCDAKNKDQLLSVLSNAMNKKDTKYSEIGKILDANGNEKKFLIDLGFQVMDSSDGKVLSFKWHSHPRDAFTLVYTLM